MKSFKRFTAVSLALLIIYACSHNGPVTIPGTIILFAQSFPTTVTSVWNPNPASDNVSRYKITLGNNTPIIVPLSACNVTSCSQVLSIPAAGNYTVTLIAQNPRLSTDGTVFNDSLPATINFTLNLAPAKITGLNITGFLLFH